MIYLLIIKNKSLNSTTMATRSTIAFVKPDNSIIQSYVHWNGDTNIQLLKKFYNTPELAEALVSLGALSSIQERLKPNEGESHSFNSPASGVTIAYHRDRGEDFEMGKFKTLIDFKAGSDDQQYNWIFCNGSWISVIQYLRSLK